MPAVLSEQRFPHAQAPAAWAAALEDLTAFERLCREVHKQGKNTASTSDKRRAAELHDSLVARSKDLVEPTALADLTEADAARIFVRSVLYVTRLRCCVMAERGFLDTAGSKTLGLYRPDYNQSNAEDLVPALQRAFGISAEAIGRIEREVEADLSDARDRHAVVDALVAEFDLYAGARGLRDSVHRFFLAIYPDASLLEDEVELVVTGGLIFFCLPFYENTLLTPRFERLSAEQRAPIEAFLKRVNGFRQTQFAHFPVFSFFKGGDIEEDLLGRLAERAGLPAAAVAEVLTTLIGILPLAEVDKYIVHDVWGHGWQAGMLNFEKMYEAMASYADRLELDDAVNLADGRSSRFGDCFTGQGELFRLDRERFFGFAQAVVTERLPVALSAAFAEIMADAVECKFFDQHPDRARDVPSSSLFKDLPSKLDLTLQDLRFYFSQATKVFRLLRKSERRQSDLAEKLCEAGAAAAQARAAVDELIDVWDELARWDFAREILWEPAEPGQLKLNVFAQIALNFLGIHGSVIEAYEHAEAFAPTILPLEGFKDLLVIGASVFYESDLARNFWRVDEFLRLKFIPLCSRLGAEREA